MLGCALWGLLVGIIAGALHSPAARADVYTWIDSAGVTNVSNLPPPTGIAAVNVSRAPPRDPAREAALREAAREAEMRALSERVLQLQAEVERSQREAPAPVVVQPAVHYAPAPAAPYVIVVSPPAPAPAYPPPVSGCDYSWGNCAFGFWPGFYPSNVVVLRDRHVRHGHPFSHGDRGFHSSINGHPFHVGGRGVHSSVNWAHPGRTGRHGRK